MNRRKKKKQKGKKQRKNNECAGSNRITKCNNKIQSDAINELFELLMQHISAEEADKLQVVEKINLAAQIREGIEQ